MRIGSLRRLALAVSSASFVLGIAGAASANGFEIPENGTEVMGRAGAWTAKADSPLALQHNPAGLAGQRGGLLVNTNLTWQSMCFKRAGSYGDVSSTLSATTFKGSGYANDPYPEVCKKNGLANVNVVPQIIYALPINEQLTLAGGLVSPSGTGKAEWGDTVTTANGSLAPAPQRYMLLSDETLIIFPTISAGYAVTPQVRLGVSLQWGIALLKFSNMSMAQQLDYNESPSQDLRADLKANNFFTPAVIAGGLFELSDDVSIGGMFRWSKDIVVTGAEVNITGPAYGVDKGNACNNPSTPCVTTRRADKITIPQPMDARLGVRWHPKRKDAKTTKAFARRDSLASDLFDIEIDLTYSHNKSFGDLGIAFPPGQGVAMASVKTAGYIPENANVPHNWKDSVGVRVGGDYIVVPDQLSVRVGAFLQTSSVDPAYAGIDFLPSTMFGGFLGGTYRVSRAVDLSAGFGHIFVKSVDNTGAGNVYGLVAQENPCTPAKTPGYRTCESINSGKYTSGYNMVSLGATFHL